MKRETLPGEAPLAAPVATARGRPRCPACQHENKTDERFCEACGSSLNLRFCAACEAVNADTAQTCYSCGAALGAAASSETQAGGGVAAPSVRRYRVRWALWLAAVLALGVWTYEYFSRGGATDVVTDVVEGKGESADARAAAPLPSESTPVRDAASPATPPAAADPSAGVPSTPKGSRTQARVTHTRPAEAGASPASPPPALPAPAARARAPTTECTEAVAALALCEIRENRGGK